MAKCVELQQTCFKTATFSLHPKLKCAELHHFLNVSAVKRVQLNCFARNFAQSVLLAAVYPLECHNSSWLYRDDLYSTH